MAAGALAQQRRIDANHDRSITVAESLRYARDLADRVGRDLLLVVDGVREPLDFAEPFIAPQSGSVDGSPLTIELSRSVPLGPGEHVLTLADPIDLPEIERSDYAFEVKQPVVLLAAGSGWAPSGIERLVSFLERSGASPDRRVSARLRVPGVPLRSWLTGGALLAGIVAVVLLLVLVRRRRRS